MKQFDLVWIIWLILVCIWNFGWPDIEPVFDVILAILLSIFAYQFRNKKT